jgi:hypothetical protein
MRLSSRRHPQPNRGKWGVNESQRGFQTSLLQRSVIIFSLLVFLLPLFFKLSSLLLPSIGSDVHQDKKALEALQTLQSALRPISLVTQRISSIEDMSDATSCPDEAYVLYTNLEKIEDKLAHLAGVGKQIQGNQRLSEHLVVDAAIWKKVMAGHGCNDLLRGFVMLAQNEGAALDSLDWSNQSLAYRLKHNIPVENAWVKIPPRVFSRQNPWGGLPGCILLDEENNRPGWYMDSGRNRYCADAPSSTQSSAKRQPAALASVKTDAELLPDSLNTILAEVDMVRLPSSPVYQEATTDKWHGANLLSINGHEREAGFNIALTLNPAAQRIAEQTARCYAGNHDACKILGLSDKESRKIGADFYENAAVRMTGIAIVDVATGKIEALASADTECYRQQYDGPGRDAHCPALTRVPGFDSDRLLNHALFSDAMPASTIKPILALGFLETPGYPVDQAKLTSQLQYSDSRGFLTRLFCLDTGGDAASCHRMAQAQEAAIQLGWNTDCSIGGEDCGKADVLFGRTAGERLDTAYGKLRPLGLSNLYGRLYTMPVEHGTTGSMQLMPENNLQFNLQRAKECEHQRWDKCVGNPVAIPVAEGFGQGNARATPLGLAGMFARLGAAAQGINILRRPYLVEAISDVEGKTLSLPGFMPGKAEALHVPNDLALRVVEGLRQGHKSFDPAKKHNGTAYSGCENAGVGDCNSIAWVAGKTGTSTFSFDHITLKEAIDQCRDNSDSRCAQVPYKWYAALFQSGTKGRVFDKAIAVLSERNWYESGINKGKVDAPGDHGPNRSAEIAFRIMNKLRTEMTAQASVGTK